VILAEILFELIAERPVVGRYAVGWCALEHGQMARGLRHYRRCLNAGRAGANLTDTFAGEINPFVGPLRGVIPVAFEIFESRNVGYIGRRQTSNRCDEVGCRESFSRLGLYVPTVHGLVVVSPGDTGVQEDISHQVEFSGDVAHITHDFRLFRIAFRPFPLFNQFLGKKVAIGVALRVTARARVAVPVPGTADVAGRIQHLDRKTEPVSQADELIQARKSGANDQCIEFGDRSGCRTALPTLYRIHALKPFTDGEETVSRLTDVAKFTACIACSVMGECACA